MDESSLNKTSNKLIKHISFEPSATGRLDLWKSKFNSQVLRKEGLA